MSDMVDEVGLGCVDLVGERTGKSGWMRLRCAGEDASSMTGGVVHSLRSVGSTVLTSRSSNGLPVFAMLVVKAQVGKSSWASKGVKRYGGSARASSTMGGGLSRSDR